MKCKPRIRIGMNHDKYSYLGSSDRFLGLVAGAVGEDDDHFLCIRSSTILPRQHLVSQGQSFVGEGDSFLLVFQTGDGLKQNHEFLSGRDELEPGIEFSIDSRVKFFKCRICELFFGKSFSLW